MTIVLRVVVNGEPYVLAGEESMSVLSAHVTAVGRLGPKAEGPRRGGPDIHVSVGGLTDRGDRRKDEHLRWGKRLSLKPGDTVSIEVLESEDLHAPTSRSPADTSSTHGFGARKRWRSAKNLYFRLRERFGAREERQEARYGRSVIKEMRKERG
jgi:hypothetical protein